MGEVYQATDTNLGREARTLAALNHPNIAQIHGLEKSAGTIALVMELVKGPTLADRIAQGAIPFDEALPIAKQIAEALEAAHEQGIIHRDLKPANIKRRDPPTPPPECSDGLVEMAGRNRRRRARHATKQSDCRQTAPVPSWILRTMRYRRLCGSLIWKVMPPRR